MTDEVSTKGQIVCCVLLLVIIGAILIYEDLTFKYDVYFDNGYENSFDIFIDGKNKGSVDPDSRVKFLISRGEHTIEIRKKNGEVFESNEVTLSEDKQYEDCKYVYNIGRKYFYYVELRIYSPEGGIKRGGWDTEDIGSETFMRYYADFDLDEKCPKEITVRYGTSWIRSKLKRRINPTATELSGTTDIVENEKESHHVTSVENSLVGYWNFDEDSGGVASDLSGNGNDGTIHGAKLVDGKHGKALSINGVDDYVEVSDSASFDLGDAMTLITWINPDKVTSYDRIIAKPHTTFASPYNMYSLIFDNAGHARFEGCIGGHKTEINGVSKIQLNEWTHIAATYDSLQLKLYVNGNLESTKDLTGGIYTNDMPIYIGCNIFYSGENFNGIIDEVRIYNYALTEDEIKSAMHSSDVSP